MAEVVVEDRNLTVNISALRKALGSGCSETAAENGYRLAVPVRAVNGQASSEILQVQREARCQLSQAERVPAPAVLSLFDRAPAVVIVALPALLLLRNWMDPRSPTWLMVWARLSSRA